jgi:ribosome-associated protein
MEKNKISSEELSRLVEEGMLEKKGFDIVTIDLRKIPNRVVDFFVICHGTSVTQVDAIADSVLETVKKATGFHPGNQEGRTLNEWVLLDYFDVAAHIFTEPVRAFYRLEELWADGEIVKTEEKAR